MESDSEFSHHEPCPSCGSKDNLARYDDGHAYCFGCAYREWGDGQPVQNRSTTRMAFALQGAAEPLPKRKLTEEICQKYRCYRDGKTLRFHYFDASGVCTGAKVKDPDKNFHWEGKNENHRFFGQHLFQGTGERVVITEGELDAMSCHQVFPTWQHVSLPDGAKSAKRSIQRQLEWLQGYKEVILFFDNDEVGRQAAKEAASVLPPGKVKIARLHDFKDASDALQAGKPDLIKRAIWDAVPFRPDGIVEGKNLFEAILTPNNQGLHAYPYKGLEKKLHGIRPGELVTFTAGSGQGKSSLCRELAVHLLQSGAKVGYLALEESNRRTALGLMSVAEGKAFHIGEHDRNDLADAYDRTLKSWPLYLFDGFGSFDPDVIYNRIEYMAQGLDVKIIILDHLSILLSGLDGDERRVIDQTMTRLRSLVEQTGISMFLVSHLRRTTGDQNHEEGARVTLGQLRGSASIAQLSDAVIALERNQQENSNTTMRVLKNRYTGEVGVACELSYDLSTCQFIEHEAEKEFDATTDF